MTRLRPALLAWTVALAACGGSPSELKHYDDSYRDFLTVCAAGATLPGVDVSSYQGSIDWNAAAQGGIKWGYAKATEGTGYQDPTFGANWSGMKSAGVHRGAYHFFHPGISGTAQADFFLNTVGALGAGDLPPMLDWEVSDGVSGGTASANAQAFIDEVQARTGKTTVIYTSPGLWSGFGASGFGGYPLWVAQYYNCYCNSQCPTMPGGWSSWQMWQYSDRGSVPGIPTGVDLDEFNGDQAALDAFAGGASSCSNPIAVGHGLGAGGPVSGACGGQPALPAGPSACGGLASGQGLGPNQSVTSCDGRYTLVMQGDGNVVLYAHGIPLWSTGTGGTDGYLFVMQTDGNLVLYSAQGCPMWSSNTAPSSGATLAVQSDGNLVVYGSSGPAWSSGTGPISPAPSGCGTIPAGTALGPGDSIQACGGCFTLVMQGDGNLVLYQSGGGAVWSSGTNPSHGYSAEMQGDGNFVIYSSSGCPVWSSNTAGNNGSGLSVQDDGNLVIYGANGAVWSSDSVACSGGCTCNAPSTTGSSTTTTTTTSSTTAGASSGTAGATGGTDGTATAGSTSGTIGTTGGTTTTGASSTTGTTGAGSGSGSTTTSSTGSGSGSTGSATGTTGSGSSSGGANASKHVASGGCGSAGAGELGAALLAVLGLLRRREWRAR